jgi:hypothetical protein
MVLQQLRCCMCALTKAEPLPTIHSSCRIFDCGWPRLSCTQSAACCGTTAVAAPAQ